MINNKQLKNWYDPDRLYRIIKNHVKDPFDSIKQLEYYLEEYPYDYTAYTIYLKYLIDLKKFEQAKTIIDYIDSLLITNYKFANSKHDDAMETSDTSLIISKIRLLFHEKEYQKAYDLLNNNWKTVSKYKGFAESKNSSKYLLEKKLNIESTLSKSFRDKYICKQIDDYSYDRFLDHIKNHLYDDIEEGQSEERAVFYDDFPIQKVVEEIKRIIPNETGFYKTLTTDTYLFKYDNNGRSALEDQPAYRNANYFKAIAFHDTNELITMFPVNAVHSRYYIDINYLKEDEKKPVKRISQIDKFNKRYGK